MALLQCTTFLHFSSESMFSPLNRSRKRRAALQRECCVLLTWCWRAGDTFLCDNLSACLYGEPWVFTLFSLWSNLMNALWHTTCLFGDKLKVRRTLKASEGFIRSMPLLSRQRIPLRMLAVFFCLSVLSVVSPVFSHYKLRFAKLSLSLSCLIADR